MLVKNSISLYYEAIQDALKQLHEPLADSADFSPGYLLPALTPEVREFFAVSDLAYAPMGHYQGKKLTLLDLTRNPATMTTKTFASLVIVARAVRYIQETGQRITIVTPSSANKAIALRDGVLRAITTGLVEPDQLRIVVVVPSGSADKLRASRLSVDDDLRGRNPIAVYPGENPGTVKSIARAVVDAQGSRTGKTNLWYTLQLENYLAADIVRAYAENDFFPSAAETPRLHVHAVSSAYGLLGHDFGRSLAGGSVVGLPPRYLLVQHLARPDMVLSLYNNGSTDRRNMPAYSYGPDSGLFTQETDPRFPAVTFDPAESIDSTFYTANPPTSAQMNEIIGRQGGGGMVVSLAECLQRYGQVRALLGHGGITLPANPTAVREWSLVMAMTGVLNAVDRGLVPEVDIVVHGSGSYSTDNFTRVRDDGLHTVHNADDLQSVLLAADGQ